MVQGLRQSKEELRTKNRSLEQANRKLAASNHTLANTVEGISEVDHLESLVNYNAAFAEMHGYTWQEMEGLSWRALIVAEDHGRVTDTIERMEDSGKCRCEVKGRRKDGSTFYEEIVMVAALGAGESRRGGHWFTRDISERKELEAQIEFRAFHDTLTGLPNRALFVERLREVCQRGAETGEDVAVLFLDLDDFKDVNDSMGHDAGDHMLSGVAARLQSLVRRGDTVARLGGDEFTVLLRDVESVNEAVEVAERILAGFKTPIELPSAKLFARASIGIAHSGQSERSPEALLHDADVAMYYAKEKTKQCYAVFSPEMNAEEAERRQLAEDLRSAIESDLLSLHYQPMIDFRTGKAVAVEAFLRWHDSLRGEIPPELLISVADEAGLMDGIWHWTLRRACRQMRSWLEVLHDDSIVMNVNVSAKEIGHPDLVNTIATALSETGLAPAKLRIEVSAKSLATEKERAIDRLRDLKGLGVALALDDFGTGSHLISRLGEYPFDVVKIDSSLTWRLDSEPEVRAIAASIVLMAEAVQVEVVGEGIETLSQLGELQELGCAFGQGYLFGKPMPPEDLLPKLVNGVFTPIHADSGVSELAA
ncbi:MAG TPA: EAL domain-containing protein, partial [Fimbriimonadaceae bacterium]|nr:EAL domain-containing protein [Fimbriimonadaceae bacterium]